MLSYDMGKRGNASRYDYLYRRIRHDIAHGNILPDEKLPSKRALAEHLRVSVVTVEGAYSQLEAEGYLQARPKRGFFVSAVEQAPPPAVRSVLMPETPTVSWRLDLARNQVDTARFPVSTWARLTRQVLSEAPEALLSPVPRSPIICSLPPMPRSNPSLFPYPSVLLLPIFRLQYPAETGLRTLSQ